MSAMIKQLANVTRGGKNIAAIHVDDMERIKNDLSLRKNIGLKGNVTVLKNSIKPVGKKAIAVMKAQKLAAKKKKPVKKVKKNSMAIKKTKKKQQQQKKKTTKAKTVKRVGSQTFGSKKASNKGR